MPGPNGETTLLGVLLDAAEVAPDQVLVHVRGDGSERAVTYARLRDEALRVAGGYVAAGVAPGTCVPLLADRGDDFQAMFWGALAAGLVPVPLAADARRVAPVWELLGRPPVAVDDTTEALLPELPSPVTPLRLATLRQGRPPARLPVADPDDVAFLQFSSGSTGAPKGVRLTHTCVLANLGQIRAAAALTPDDVVASWMPYFHDMGLIGTHLAPLALRAKQVRLEPLTFAKRPTLWLETAARHRATVLSAANFALALATRRIPDEVYGRLDLSAVRLLLVGAEPIAPAVWRRFATKARASGLAARAPQPVYGLAEATLAVTFPPLDEVAAPRVLDRAALSHGQAVDTAPGPDAVELMDVGLPVPGCEVRIADDAGHPLDDRRVGHIHVRGPQVARGYHEAPEATATTFADGWLRTGDLGFLDNGRLCVTGRDKDVVFVNGRTYHAPDLEAVAAATPGLPTPLTAVVGSTDPTNGTERVVVFVQWPRPPREATTVLAEMASRVRQALAHDDVRVLPLPPAAFPRTTSGKLRRRTMRDRFETGAYAPIEAQWAPPGAVAVTTPMTAGPGTGTPPEGTPTEIAPAKGTPPETTPTANAPANSVPAEHDPGVGSPPEDTPAKVAPTEEAPAEGQPTAAVPAGAATPAEGGPAVPDSSGIAEGRAAEGSLTEGNPVEGTPAAAILAPGSPADPVPAEGGPPPAAPAEGGPATAIGGGRAWREVAGVVTAVWARVLGQPVGAIGAHDRFLAIGGSSLKAMEVLAALEDTFGVSVPPGVLRDRDTVAALTEYLVAAQGDERPEGAGNRPAAGEATATVAIVSMACRFPGADSPEAFWDRLVAGHDAVGPVPGDRWATRPESTARWGAFLADPAGFDAAYFGIDEQEATATDPQGRIFLELAHEALERAGYAGSRRAGRRVGVFAATGESGYREVLARAAGPEGGLPPAALTGNLPNLVAARVAQSLDLTGPALAVDTACSSALVALHLARRSLESGECDLAVVGGVNLELSPTGHRLLEQAGVLSPTGRCRAFSATADGFVPGEGGAAIVLARLDDAQRADDPVLAVLRGTSVNNDGRSLSLLAPNALTQRDIIVQAYRDAGVDPDSVSYVEAHGTGTALGDPVELRSLRQAFEPRSDGQPRWLGSVKTNVGHLLNAAAMPSLVKVILALGHRELPASLHHDAPGEADDFAVVGEHRPWTAPGPLVAGVNAFGFGGTNAHAILEEAPPRPAIATEDDGPHLLTLSARSADALEVAARDLVTHLRAHPELAEGDVCATVNTARDHGRHRLAVVSRGGDLAERLAAHPAPAVATARPRLVFLLPGQGTVRPGAGRELYRRAPAFRQAIDEASALIGPVYGRTLAQWCLDPDATPADLARTEVAQPLLVAYGVALARQLHAWGVTPDAVSGHSVGEIAAACVAGALTLAEAVRFAAERGRLMRDLAAPGAMAAVRGGEDAVAAVVAESAGALCVAAVNAPDQTVISGAPEAIDRAVARLAAEGISTRVLPVSHGFHSPAMLPVADPLATSAATLAPRPPSVPLLSTLTAEWQPHLDPAHWREHALRPVRFGDAVERLLDDGYDTFLELGPGTTLPGPVRSVAAVRGGTGRAPEVFAAAGTDVWPALLTALGRLWARGVDLDHAALGAGRARVAVPTYPFQRRRYWPEPVAAPLLHRLTWRDAPLTTAGDAPRAVRLAGPDSELARALAHRLERRGIAVLRGDASPAPSPPVTVLLAGPATDCATVADLDATTHTVLSMVSALRDVFTPMSRAGGRLVAVTEDVHATGAGGERLRPAQALLTGLTLALPEEYPGLTAYSVDVSSYDSLDVRLDELEREVLGRHAPEDGGAGAVAWRAGRRLVRTPAAVAADPPPPSPLPPDGTYLITGGTGGIGAALARDLAGRGRPTLVLVGRSAHAADGLTAELGALGATVEYRVADVSAEADVEALVAGLPPLDGVFHAAGVVRPGTLRTKSPEEMAEVMAAKVRGSLLLSRALWRHGHRPAVCVAFSSVAAVLPGLAGALGDYAAGNAFLDAFAAAERAAGRPWQSLNFAAFANTGLIARPPSRAAVAPRGPAPLTTEAGLSALHTACGMDTAQLLVATLPVKSATGPSRTAPWPPHAAAPSSPAPAFAAPATSATDGSAIATPGTAASATKPPTIAPAATATSDTGAPTTGATPPPTTAAAEPATSGVGSDPSGTDTPSSPTAAAAGPATPGTDVPAPDTSANALPTTTTSGTGVPMADITPSPTTAATGPTTPGTNAAAPNAPTNAPAATAASGTDPHLSGGNVSQFDGAPSPITATTGAATSGAEPDASRTDAPKTDTAPSPTTTATGPTTPGTDMAAPNAPTNAPAATATSGATPSLTTAVEGPGASGADASAVNASSSATSGTDTAPSATAAAAGPAGGPGASRPLADTAAPPAPPRIADITRRLLAEALHRPPGEVDDDEPFLTMGLDSLSAVDLVRRLEAELGRALPPTLFFEYRTIRELAAHLAENHAGTQPPAQPPHHPTNNPTDAFATGKPHPLTPVQLAFHTGSRLHPEVAAYAYVRQTIGGALDTRLLGRALAFLSGRHPMLRIRIEPGPGGTAPTQRVTPTEPDAVPSWYEVRDTNDGPLADLEEALCNRPFDLAAEAPVRAVLVRERADLAHLLLVLHHAAADGFSVNVLGEELWSVYTALAHGRTPQLPPPHTNFADYATALDAERSSPEAAEDRHYWHDLLADRTRPLDLPWAAAPNTTPVAPLTAHQVATDPGLTAALRTCAATHGVSLFHLLLAAYARCLARWSGQRAITVNVARARRELRLAGLDQLVGPLADTLPLLATVDPDEPVPTLAQRLRDIWLDAERHARLTGLDIARLLPATGARPRTPSPAGFSFARFPATTDPACPVTVRPTAARTASAATRLGLLCWESDGALHFSWNFPARLFTPATVERLAREHLAELTELATPTQREDIVARLCARFRAAADQVAVDTGEATMTYAALDQASATLAARLRAHGVTPGDLVGLLTEPGADTVVGVVGILRAGAGWVPLDAAHPTARLADQLHRSTARTVVCHAATRTTADAFDKATAIAIDDPSPTPTPAPNPAPTDPDAIAYTIFTSGSTGRPKAVPITHRAMANYLDWAVGTFGYRPGDRLAQTASVCFDASVRQLLAPLLVGATVHTLPRNLVRDPEALLDRVVRDRITVWSSVPTLWERLLTAAETRVRRGAPRPDLSALRWIHVGGEALPADHVRRWYDLFGPGHRIANLYGPTEATINATCHLIDTRPGDEVRRLPIGLPISGTEVAVVAEDGRHCAPDEPGELLIGGTGLTPGYLGDPERTAAAFTERDGKRWYRSGDRVSRRPDGVLDFLGRLDDQVKVRGHRVEPGEIEAVLHTHPAVAQAAVLHHHGRLTAFVEPAPGTPRPEPALLRAHLCGTLPDYMLPARFRYLDTLPLTGTGKVDRRRLDASPPDPDTATATATATTTAPDQTPPATPTEHTLARIWSEVLGVTQVSREDDFFTLGGDSILVLEVFARLDKTDDEARRNTTLPRPTVIYEHSTLTALATAIDEATETGAQQTPTTPPETAGAAVTPYPLTPTQRGFLVAEAIAPGSGSAWLARLRLRGPLRADLFQRAVDTLLVRHPMLRTVFPAGARPPVQQELPPALRLPVDFETLASPEELDERIADERRRRFEPWAWPLLRLRVLTLAPDEHTLVVHAHHLIGDGYSAALFGRELLAVYDQLDRGEQPELPPLRSTFRDYVTLLQQPAPDPADDTVWRARHDTPYERPELRSPDAGGGDATEVGFTLDAEVTAGLRHLAATVRATPYAPVLTAYYRALADLTGQRDLVLGLAVTGRDHALPDIGGLFGPLAAAVPLRPAMAEQDRTTATTSFRDDLRRIAEEATAARAYGTSGEPSGHGHSHGLPRATQFLFSYLDFSALGPPTGASLTLDWDHHDTELTPPPVGTDVFLAVRPVGDGLRVTLRASAAALDATATEAFARTLRDELTRAVAPHPRRTARTSRTDADRTDANRTDANRTDANRTDANRTDTTDAALVGYLPAPGHLAALAGVPATALPREHLRALLFPDGGPRLLEEISTPLGRSAFVSLPLFADELAPGNGLIGHTARAVTHAASLGARCVSLAGMIPAYTGYGFEVVRATGGATTVTTGHAATAVSVVKTVHAALAAEERELGDLTVAMVGLGSIGTSSLNLLLSSASRPPARLVLCDLAGSGPRLRALAGELRGSGLAGLAGPVETAESAPDLPLPDVVYEADLIVTAVSGGTAVLDVDRLRPGTVVVDDSFPHCFDTARALDRMRQRRDVLTVGGGLLAVGDTKRHIADDLPPAAASGYAAQAWLPDTVASCRLESLLHTAVPGLPLVHGLVDASHAHAYWEAVKAAGVSAAPLHLLGHTVETEH